MLLKTDAAQDDFAAEKYHDQLAAKLDRWRNSLLRSPRDTAEFENMLHPDFLGSPLAPVHSRLLRPGPIAEARQNIFSTQPNLGRQEFSRELRLRLSGFSEFIVAKFDIIAIDFPVLAGSGIPDSLRTLVRYEFVGSGNDFYREQRVGTLELKWKASAAGEFNLFRLTTLEETQSRSLSEVFRDISFSALGFNPSFSRQLLRGVDYWRTVLDGSSGIDIYGHNGVSVADIDNDGFDDLYICQPAGLPNRLYRNRGDGTFEDITEASGLGLLDPSSCSLFADFENKGNQDAIIVTASGPQLFLNQGGGKFKRKPDAFNFATTPQGTFTGAAAADYDRDGWLDIYFCLYSYYQGADQYRYPVPYHDAENGPPNFLMRNQRDGTFRDVTAESGLNKNNTRYSFCCGWADYNRDGCPDLYVVNDFGRKNLYRNNRDGTFTDVAAEAGVEDVGAGMSVAWLDCDNSGAQDLYVGDMWTAAGLRISAQENFRKDSPEAARKMYRKHAMGNSLFQNRGAGFDEVTGKAGVAVGRWAWSSDSLDFDHDGFPDLYVTNGMISGRSGNDLNSFFWRQVVASSPDQARASRSYEQGWNAINELIRSDGTWSGYERNIFYANNRDGTFSGVSGAVGLDFIEDGRAFALADFDHDGRQEIFLKNRNAPQLRVLKNLVPEIPPSIAFRLRGKKSNRDAIGAVVTVGTVAGRQTRELQAGSGFLSQHSKELFFGLGDHKGSVKASIRWPSGELQQFVDLPVNHRISIEEGETIFSAEPFRPPNRHGNEKSAPVEQLPAVSESWLLSPIAAPQFSLADERGHSYELASFRGKPLLLILGISRSAACRKQLDAFQSNFTRLTAQALQLVFVNCDSQIDGDQATADWRTGRLSFPMLRISNDIAGIYNLLFRYIFDRHCNLDFPTSFLIDEKGQIVKVYRGSVDPDRALQDSKTIPRSESHRLALALPFTGNADTFEFGRNFLSYGSILFQYGYFEESASAFRQALSDSSSAEAAYGLGSACLNLKNETEAKSAFLLATRLPAGYPGTLANAWNNLGLLATRENHTGEAIENFQKALRLSPDHLIALNNLGNAYRLEQKWEDAKNAFQRALEVDAGDAEANYGLGMVYAQVGNPVRAEELLQRALQSVPDYPEALNNLGILYLRTGRRDRAVQTFQRCIRGAPKFDQAYLNLARVYAIENTPEKAKAVLLNLLKEVPDDAQAQSMLLQIPQ